MSGKAMLTRDDLIAVYRILGFALAAMIAAHAGNPKCCGALPASHVTRDSCNVTRDSVTHAVTGVTSRPYYTYTRPFFSSRRSRLRRGPKGLSEGRGPRLRAPAQSHVTASRVRP